MYFNMYHHHHHISVMELGHLLTRSALTCPEVSSKFCHDSFCQSGNSVSLPWVFNIYDLFYSQNSHKHLPAGITAFFRVMFYYKNAKLQIWLTLLSLQNH
jgi:hypothetical protein